MSKAKEGSKVLNPLPKMPSLNFGKKPVGFGSVGKGINPKSFIPPTVRVTQNKGSGGK